ncbi:MAG: HAMP domain-containing protein [Candidatus Hydrogenedentota bacterium]
MFFRGGPKMFKLTLAGKIALLVAIFIIITVSIGTNIFLYRLDQITEDDIIRKVNVITNTLMPSLSENILKNELSTIETVIELLVASDKDIALIIVKDDENKTLAEKRGVLGKYKKFASRIIIPGTDVELGFVEIFYNRDSFLQKRDEIKKEMVKFAVILVLFSIIISSLLSTRLTKQLEKLTAASIKVREGDLNQSVTPRTRDEIGTLAQVFNEMVLEIKKSHEKLQKANDELSAIYEVGKIISSSDNINDVFQLSLEALQTGFGAKSGAIYQKSEEDFLKKLGFEKEDLTLPEKLSQNELSEKGLKTEALYFDQLSDKNICGTSFNGDDVIIPLPAGDKIGGLIILNDYEKLEDKDFLLKLFTILGSMLGPAIVTAKTLEFESKIRNEPFRLLVEVLKDEFIRAKELDYPLTLIKFVVQSEIISGEEIRKFREEIYNKLTTTKNVISVYPGELIAVLPGKDKKEIRRTLLTVELDKTINNNPVRISFVSYPEEAEDIYKSLLKLRG